MKTIENKYDKFREFVNPFLWKIELELVKITIDSKFVGIGIRLYQK